MYYSYVEIEYVATSFSPARTDLALKLLRFLNRQKSKKIHFFTKPQKKVAHKCAISCMILVPSPVIRNTTSICYPLFYVDYAKMALPSTHSSVNWPSKKLNGLVIGSHHEVQSLGKRRLMPYAYHRLSLLVLRCCWYLAHIVICNNFIKLFTWWLGL